MKFMGIDLGDVKSTLSNVGNWNNVVQQFDSLKKKNDVLEDDILAAPYDYSYDCGWNAAIDHCSDIVKKVFSDAQ